MGVGVGACCAGVPLFDVEPAGVTIIPVVIPFLGVGQRVTMVGCVCSVHGWSWWEDIARIGQGRRSEGVLVSSTTSTSSNASRAGRIRISTHVEWNPWILFSWDSTILFSLCNGIRYTRSY